jgi:hypothetical protein
MGWFPLAITLEGGLKRGHNVMKVLKLPYLYIWTGPTHCFLESSGWVAYMETHPKTNTYEHLPIVNTLLLWTIPHGEGDVWAHGMINVGVISDATS